jgi:hypothetical protein
VTKPFNTDELLARLREDITDEQQLVRQLLSAHGGRESTVAQTVAWLGEKLTRVKIGPGENDDSGLMLFETLEALSLGFWGRRALWRTLEQLQRAGSIEARVDFGALAFRAGRHLDQLEESRLLASLVAFSAEAIA